jgi:hypothetical protein
VYSRDPQYEWLKADLATVDCTTTPWLIVMVHFPFYSTNSAKVEIKKNKLKNKEQIVTSMLGSIEGLLYDHGVDIVYNGHVHAYERTHPVYKNKASPCGPVYLTLGDGGNLKGVHYFLNLEGLDDYDGWSAFREASFGAGSLYIVNRTHSYYQWDRGACDNFSSYIYPSKLAENTPHLYDKVVDAPGGNSSSGRCFYSPQTYFPTPYGRGITLGPTCTIEGADSRPFKHGKHGGLVVDRTVTSDATWFVRDVSMCPNKGRSGAAAGTWPLRRISKQPACTASGNSRGKNSDSNAAVIGGAVGGAAGGLLLSAIIYFAVAFRKPASQPSNNPNPKSLEKPVPYQIAARDVDKQLAKA